MDGRSGLARALARPCPSGGAGTTSDDDASPPSWPAASSHAPPPGLSGALHGSGAPLGVPSVPVWDDVGRQRISTQAAQLIIGFNYFEASKALDPYWSAKFWQWIEPTLGVLVPEIRTLLEGHGYVGAVTTSPPRDTFRREVESYRDTGAPPHGAGGAIAWTPTSALQAATPPQGTAW